MSCISSPSFEKWWNVTKTFYIQEIEEHRCKGLQMKRHLEATQESLQKDPKDNTFKELLKDIIKESNFLDER
jgi:hypothetical protein